MKRFQAASLRVQISVVLVVSTLVMVIYTSISSYGLATREFRKMSAALTENITGTTVETVAEYFRAVDGHTGKILSIPALRQYIRSGESTTSSSVISSISLRLRGSVTEAVRENIRFLRVDMHMMQGLSFSSRGLCMDDGYAACLASLEKLGFSVEDGYIGTQWGLTPAGDGAMALTCVRFLYNDFAQKVGVSVFQISDEGLLPLFNNLQGAYLASASGLYLTPSGDLAAGAPIRNEELTAKLNSRPLAGTLISRKGLSNTLTAYCPVIGRSVWLVVPVDTYEEIVSSQTSDYSRSVFLTLACGILFSVLIARFLSRNVSRSVTALTEFMNRIDIVSVSNSRYSVSGANEIVQIGEKVNQMLDTLQTAYDRRESDLKAQQALELKLLRSQINPHLLYNTLNSALWAIQSGKNEEASAMVTDLSEYFKLTLSGGRQEITLEEELKLIGHYLRIQRLARHSTVELETAIPPALMAHPILKLTLQPIVENAVIHGLDGYRSDGTIRITAAREGPYLRIRVSDNGIGIEPDELYALRAALHSAPAENTGRSFGLYCINRALRQIGGAACGLLIESEVSEFTTVTVTMPYRETKEEPYA